MNEEEIRRVVESHLVGVPIQKIEQILIESAMRHYGYRKPEVARAVGISLKTLYNRLRDYYEAA